MDGHVFFGVGAQLLSPPELLPFRLTLQVSLFDCSSIANALVLSPRPVSRYSFGTGAQVLPIPELMPFRLTRQMRGVLQPHDACALLRTPCALCMAALRGRRRHPRGLGRPSARHAMCLLSRH